jgi:F420-dependent oxidoreductase-like protein
MKLCITYPYAGNVKESADLVADLEKAGLDIVLVPEAYSFDAVSVVGYLAAKTSILQIGTGILNVYSRTPALLGMTAAGCDNITDGRFLLGLGASGPQVVEGFHAMPYDKPLARTLDCIEVVRKVLRREVLVHEGSSVTIPLPADQGTGLAKPLKLINHPIRPAVPIWWASLMQKAVEATAEVADGWMPLFFAPERAHRVWGEALAAGAAKRSSELAPLDVIAGGPTAIGEDLDISGVEQKEREHVALYVGGMGARGKNFYNTICQQYGWEREAALIQDLYLDGRKQEAAAEVPQELVDSLHLCGPEGLVKDRIAAYREAGVTVLAVEPVAGQDPVRTIESLRRIADA